MRIFEQLGASIETLWRSKNYSDELFPGIAAEALSEVELNQRVTPWDILHWLHATPQIPTQHDVEGRFGEPPITLYAGPRFYIDVYFWVDGTTAIHQHGFSGAFQVLLGSSIHSRYSFKEERRLNDRFIIGQLVFNNSELLKEGDIRKILPGKEFIHALFHLDRPSATITVRTQDAVTSQPQYSYLKPHLAYDPFFREPAAIKKLQTVSLLLAIEHQNAEAVIGDLLASSDFQTAFSVLQMSYSGGAGEMEKRFGVSQREERFHRLLEVCRRRHGQLVDVIPPILEEQQRINDLVKRRSSITEKEHRFFLALLLNVPSRQKILELVKEHFPTKDPVETVLEWVSDLSTTKVWGSSEANVLGIKDFGNDHLLVLENLLRGRTRQQMKAAVRKEYGTNWSQNLTEKLDGVAESLRESAFFSSVLSD